MPQSSATLPSPISRRPASSRSTDGCSFKLAGISVRRLESSFSLAAVDADVRRPVDGERGLQAIEDPGVGALARVERRAHAGDELVAVARLDDTFLLQLVGVELARARVLRDLLVHERLGHERLVL